MKRVEDVHEVEDPAARVESLEKDPAGGGGEGEGNDSGVSQLENFGQERDNNDLVNCQSEGGETVPGRTWARKAMAM